MAKMTKEHCHGCEDDFYNGHNPMGVKECWCFRTAKLIPRIRVGVWQNPPYKQKATMVPSCRKEKGNVLVAPEALDSQGFWRAFGR